MTDATWKKRLVAFKADCESDYRRQTLRHIVRENRRISTWDEFEQWHASLGEGYCFRGQEKSKWFLDSSFDRMVRYGYRYSKGHYAASGSGHYMQPKENLEMLLNSYKAGTHAHHTSSAECKDMIECFSQMQHHEAPTRLLDFSYSPHVALYFALRKTTTKQPASVWAIDMNWLDNCWKQLLGKRQGISDDGKRYEFVNRALLQGDKPGLVTWVRPRNVNERMRLQKGLLMFSCYNELPVNDLIAQMTIYPELTPKRVIQKIAINTPDRLNILAKLEKMNISKAMLMPTESDCPDCLELGTKLRDALPKQKIRTRLNYYKQDREWVKGMKERGMIVDSADD